jgi:urease accessory protein
MSVDVSPFEVAAASGVPGIRARGVARLRAERIAGQTVAMDIDEQGPLRLRFPRIRVADALETIIVNTGGGVVGGDRLQFEIEADEAASVSVSSQAAEKMYRSSGADAEISVRLVAGPRARLVWLPQEAILFDRARVKRSIEADIADDGSLTVCEGAVFGRAAMGERVQSGMLRDRWRVHRGGRLVFADALALDGSIAAMLDRPAVARGAIAVATLLQVAPDAESRIDAVRSTFEARAVEAGASAFDGMLVARFLAADGSAVRAAVLAAVSALGIVAPRAYTL